MHKLALKTHQIFAQHADPTLAAPMEKYMKHRFKMFGIKRPQRNRLQRDILSEVGLPPPNEIVKVLKDLWKMEERECQYFGLDLVKRLVKKQPPGFIRTLEYLITHKSWWDTVDLLATSSGALMQVHPTLNPEVPNRWIETDHMWLQRSAILFQLKYKDQTNWGQLQTYILVVADSSEFFLQKAAGWALREYSKTAPHLVREFIDGHQLAKLTVREGSKYL